MSEQGFSEQWLALREPADQRARAAALLPGLAADLTGVVPAGDALSVLDLGAGSGANLRWLAPRLAALGLRDQHWTCVDHDPRLQASLPVRCAAWAPSVGARAVNNGDGLTLVAPGWRCQVRLTRVDLATGLNGLVLPTDGLLTASALLDLVSADWLDRLLASALTHRCRLLFALSYDGRATLAPAHPEDAAVLALINRHQRGDKGFGPALGPTAATAVVARCNEVGYCVESAASDWRIGATEPDLQRALLAGWHFAARELAPTSAWLDAWQGAHAQAIDAGRLRIQVGHQDLVAMPRGAVHP